jgi:hypothetical protein
MIKRLPAWCIINKFPAFYDIESATAIEQTARIYGKMNELVESYNKFATELTDTVNHFIDETESDCEVFKIAIRQEFQDFINVIDLKVQALEKTYKDIVDSAEGAIAQLEKDFQAFKTEFIAKYETFKTEITSYIDNELETTILEKWEEFINDGSLNAIIEPYLSENLAAKVNSALESYIAAGKLNSRLAALVATEITAEFNELVESGEIKKYLTQFEVYEPKTESYTLSVTTGGEYDSETESLTLTM